VSRVARVVLAAVLAAVVGVLVLPGARADDAESVLDRARNATVREDFSGLVQIEWLADGEWQTARVPVTGTGGTVQVGEGVRKAEGRGNERWIAGVSGWQAGWDEAVTGNVPSPSKHWDLALTKGTEIAGRPTLVVTATDPRTDEARLKVYCDRDTGVMLRREVLDAKGRVVRAVGFVEVKKLGGTRDAAPADPKAKKSKDSTPDRVASVPDGFDAPATVADRYVLAGRYLRPDGIVQLYYTDGLFGVSVFQQRGDLDTSGLPRGSEGVAVGDARGRGYEVAGGTVLVWDHEAMTRTVVSDATIADLRAFAAAFDDRTEHHGGIVEDITDFVLAPFRWN
jgi:sigma-E factor negative regulatory protein RseB